MPKCPSGMIPRRAHTRVLASGKKIKISSVCVNVSKSPRKSPKKSLRKSPSRSPKKSPKRLPKRSPSKSPVRIKVRKGTLSKYGYSTHYPVNVRKQALERAAEEEGWLPIFRKLNVIAVFNKNRNPELHDLLLRDRDWVRKMFG